MGLPILGDTGFKCTNTSSNSQNSTVSLGCACNHIFYEVSVSWGINDSNIVLAVLKFPQGDISGDTMLSFSFQLVQDPGLCEGDLSHLTSPFLKLFNCSLSLSLFFFHVLFLFISFIFISWRLITLQYCSGFCHTLT